MRRLWLIVCVSVPLFACSKSSAPAHDDVRVALVPSGPDHANALGDHSPGRWLDHERAPALYLAQMKEMIRRHAALIYGPDCGNVRIPDAAFFAIEITGGLAPELAVSFGYAECGPISNSFFRGNVGTHVQFWIGEGGRPRLLLEGAIHGFTPGDRQLVTVQHGGACRATGTDLCRVTYRWDELDQRLGTAERRRFSTLPKQPEVAFFGNLLTGTGPCDARQARLPADQRRCGR